MRGGGGLGTITGLWGRSLVRVGGSFICMERPSNAAFSSAMRLRILSLKVSEVRRQQPAIALDIPLMAQDFLGSHIDRHRRRLFSEGHKGPFGGVARVYPAEPGQYTNSESKTGSWSGGRPIGAGIGGRRARLLEGVPSPLPGGPSRRATTGFAAAWSAMAGLGEAAGDRTVAGMVSAAARLLRASQVDALRRLRNRRLAGQNL